MVTVFTLEEFPEAGFSYQVLRTDSIASPSLPLPFSLPTNDSVVFLVGLVYKQKCAALLFGIAMK